MTEDRGSLRVQICVAMVLLFVLASATGCGGPDAGPSAPMTEARIQARNWRFSAASAPNTMVGASVETLNRIFDLGPGEQCGTAVLLQGGDGSLTLTIGRTSKTIQDPQREVTLCGRGPVTPLPTDRSQPHIVLWGR